WSYRRKDPKSCRTRQCALRPRLDSPRGISSTTAWFHRHSTASPSTGEGLNYTRLMEQHEMTAWRLRTMLESKLEGRIRLFRECQGATFILPVRARRS